MALVISDTGLPGDAVPWGRAVSNSAMRVGEGIESLSGSLSNLSASSTGQVSRASRLVDERSNRGTHYVGISDFTVSAPGSGLWATAHSDTVYIPGPDSRRSSLLYVSGGSSLVRGTDSAIVWWELIVNGAIVGGVSTVVTPESPDWETPSFILSSTVLGPSTVQVRARLQKFSGRPMAVSWYNGSAAMIYGDKIL